METLKRSVPLDRIKLDELIMIIRTTEIRTGDFYGDRVICDLYNQLRTALECIKALQEVDRYESLP